MALRSYARRAGAWSLLRGVAANGFLPPSVWTRLPVETIFRVPFPGGTDFRYSSRADEAMGRCLFWKGLCGYEPETARVFVELAKNARMVLDVGAHTGFYALLACASNPYCEVISFEPVPYIRGRLIENIRINGWEERCQTREEAVSDSVGSAKLHVLSDDSLPSSSSLNPSGYRGYQGHLIDVRVTTLDAILRPEDPVDLVKIDVEGFEDKVLGGMRRVLAQCRPKIIVSCDKDGPVAAIESILGKFGYRFFHLQEKGWVSQNRIVPDARGRYRNYLCQV